MPSPIEAGRCEDTPLSILTIAAFRHRLEVCRAWLTAYLRRRWVVRQVEGVQPLIRSLQVKDEQNELALDRVRIPVTFVSTLVDRNVTRGESDG